MADDLLSLGTLLSGKHGFAQDFIDQVIPHVGLLHVHSAFKTCRALRDAVRVFMAALPTQTFENYLPRALRPLAAAARAASNSRTSASAAPP